MEDLSDDAVRAAVTARLAALYAGRPVIVGPSILAARADRETGNTLVAADTATGLFAKLDPCAALVHGQRLATVNAGLFRFVDREFGTGFGALEAAPDVRRPVRQ